jgi:hypothetical protein
MTKTANGGFDMRRSLGISVYFFMVAALLGSNVRSAAAGIGDSAVPPLMGVPAKHVWSVPGMLSKPGVTSAISCTNVATDNVRIGVEVFGPAGGPALNDPSSTSVEVVNGATVVWSATPLGSLGNAISLGAGPFLVGSGRVIATSNKGIICSAFLLSPGSNPGYLGSLPLVAKLKQKGD